MDDDHQVVNYGCWVHVCICTHVKLQKLAKHPQIAMLSCQAEGHEKLFCSCPCACTLVTKQSWSQAAPSVPMLSTAGTFTCLRSWSFVGRGREMRPSAPCNMNVNNSQNLTSSRCTVFRMYSRKTQTGPEGPPVGRTKQPNTNEQLACCTSLAHHLNVTCTSLARHLHVACTSLARHFRITCTSLARQLHVACTSLARQLHVTCMSLARYLHTDCSATAPETLCVSDCPLTLGTAFRHPSIH